MRSCAVLALTLLMLLTPLVPRSGIAPPAAAARKRPNIVLILADDLDAGSLRFLPNVASLLQDRGLTFPNFFATSPNCCPSRASILRGQYAHNHGVLRNNGQHGGFPTFHNLDRERSTIATWLQEVGYRTALLGKYLNRYPQGATAVFVPPGWDEWYVSKKNGYFDYEMVENGRVVTYGSSPEDYFTDVLSAHATDFIERSAERGRPFFLYLSPRAPHDPATPAPRHAGAFAGAQAPRPPSFNEDNVADKPKWVRTSPRLDAATVARIDEEYRRRLESMLAVDEMVAAVIDTLAATGTLDNTYVVFASDNGFHLGEHRQPSRKGTPYDEAVRIPMIVRGPGIAAGTENNAFVTNIDLAPTFADLARVATPEFVDGRSLVPLFRGSTRAGRDAILIEDFGGNGAEVKFNDPKDAARGNGVPPFRALRTSDLLYVEYASGERELYDRRRDPFERENIVAGTNKAYVKELASHLKTLATCARSGCREAEDQPVPPIGDGDRRSAERRVTLLASTGKVVAPEADARVHEKRPGDNYGRANELAVDGGDAEIASYLRFDVPPLKGRIERATLRLFVPKENDAGSRDGPAVAIVSNGWSEGGLTWQNRPEHAGDRLDNSKRLTAGDWAEFDVSDAVTRAGTYSFLLIADSDDGVIFASRESGTPPQLVVETSRSLKNASTKPPKSAGRDRARPNRPDRDGDRVRQQPASASRRDDKQGETSREQPPREDRPDRGNRDREGASRRAR